MGTKATLSENSYLFHIRILLIHILIKYQRCYHNTDIKSIIKSA